MRVSLNPAAATRSLLAFCRIPCKGLCFPGCPAASSCRPSEGPAFPVRGSVQWCGYVGRDWVEAFLQGLAGSYAENAVLHDSFLILSAGRDRRCGGKPGYNRTTACQPVEGTTPPWAT